MFIRKLFERQRERERWLERSRQRERQERKEKQVCGRGGRGREAETNIDAFPTQRLTPNKTYNWEWARLKPATRRLVTVSHIGHRDSPTLTIAWCLPACTLVESWNWEQRYDPNLGTPK